MPQRIHAGTKVLLETDDANEEISVGDMSSGPLVRTDTESEIAHEVSVPSAADADTIRRFFDGDSYCLKSEDGSITPVAGGVGETESVMVAAHHKEFHRIVANDTPVTLWEIAIPNDSIVHVDGRIGVYGAGDANLTNRVVTFHETSFFSLTSGAAAQVKSQNDDDDTTAGDITVFSYVDGTGGDFVLGFEVSADSAIVPALVAGHLDVRVYALDHTVSGG